MSSIMLTVPSTLSSCSQRNRVLSLVAHHPRHLFNSRILMLLKVPSGKIIIISTGWYNITNGNLRFKNNAVVKMKLENENLKA